MILRHLKRCYITSETKNVLGEFISKRCNKIYLQGKNIYREKKFNELKKEEIISKMKKLVQKVSLNFIF